MLRLWFELFFLLIILTVGIESGFNIHKMAGNMRKKAIHKVLEPWPSLPVMKNPELP